MQLYQLTKYESISTDLFWLDKSSKLVLYTKFNKQMMRNGLQEQRFFYGEYYNAGMLKAFMHLNWSLIISGIKADYAPNRSSFSITDSDMYQFIQAINTMKKWLTEEIGENLFYKDKNGIIKCNNTLGVIKITNVYDQHLEMSPVVRYYGMAEAVPGVEIFLNNDIDGIFMHSMRFLNFCRFMETFNPISTVFQVLMFMMSIPEPGSVVNNFDGSRINFNRANRTSGLLQRMNAVEVQRDIDAETNAKHPKIKMVSFIDDKDKLNGDDVHA